MMKLTKITLLLAALWATPALASGASGTWAMSNGKVTVRVSDCGPRICGTIVGLKQPISKIDGKPKVDRENPNPALRQRRLIGLSILFAMRPVGVNTWRGAIYNPDDGRTYGSTMKLEGNTMQVEGCVLRVLCKTNTFRRLN